MEKIFQSVATEVILFQYVYVCISFAELSVHRAFLNAATYYKHIISQETYFS